MKWTPELKEENRKIRHLKLMVELTTQLLYQTPDLTLIDGLNHIKAVKDYSTILFPGKERTFDLIYKPRLMRILVERGLLTLPSN